MLIALRASSSTSMCIAATKQWRLLVVLAAHVAVDAVFVVQLVYVFIRIQFVRVTIVIVIDPRALVSVAASRAAAEDHLIYRVGLAVYSG